eukprot:jgi/Bigna1/128015/aug1.5_g2723
MRSRRGGLAFLKMLLFVVALMIALGLPTLGLLFHRVAAVVHRSKLLGKKKPEIVEDKFCGMRNKNKSKKIQRQIQLAKQQAIASKQKPKQKSKQELKNEKRRELAKLVNVEQPPIPVGVDPKTVFCERFKANLCLRGSKCRYSHDSSIKQQKLYDPSDHRQKFKLEREIGILEKEKQLAIEREDYMYAQSLKDDIEKLKKTLWTTTAVDDEKRKQGGNTVEGTRSLFRDMSIEEKPITRLEFMKWYQAKVGAEAAQKRQNAKARRTLGSLTGREYFLQLKGTTKLRDGEDNFMDSSEAEGLLDDYKATENDDDDDLCEH